MGQEKHYCMVQLWYFLHGLTITTTTKTVKMYLTLCKPTTISKKKKNRQMFYGTSLSVRQNWQKCLFILVVSIDCSQRLFRIKSPRPATQSELCSCTAPGCEWLRSPPHWLHGRINSRKRTPQVSAVVRSIFNTLSSVAVNTAHLRCLRKPQNTNNCY